MNQVRQVPRWVRFTAPILAAVSVAGCGSRSQPVPDAASAASHLAASRADSDAVREAVAPRLAADTPIGRCGDPILIENGGEIARYTCTVTFVRASGRPVRRFIDHVDCVITPGNRDLLPQNCFAGASAGNARSIPLPATPAG
jgi:outer membrane murein-binding lipoprotein Lpp